MDACKISDRYPINLIYPIQVIINIVQSRGLDKLYHSCISEGILSGEILKYLYPISIIESFHHLCFTQLPADYLNIVNGYGAIKSAFVNKTIS